MHSPLTRRKTKKNDSPLEAHDIQLIPRGYPNVLHEYHPGGARPQRALALDLRRRQSPRVAFDDVSAYLPDLVACPYDEEIRYGAVRYPILRAVEHVFVRGRVVLGTGFHRRGIRTVIRFLGRVFRFFFSFTYFFIVNINSLRFGRKQTGRM